MSQRKNRLRRQLKRQLRRQLRRPPSNLPKNRRKSRLRNRPKPLPGLRRRRYGGPRISRRTGSAPRAAARRSRGTGAGVILNGAFEGDASAWVQSSRWGYELICGFTSCGDNLLPHTGDHLVWLGGTDLETAQIEQRIILPAGKAALLDYWYRIESEDLCGYDTGQILAIAGDKKTALRSFDLCRDEQTREWVHDQIDLTRFAGQEITLAFRAETDIFLRSSLFIDDVALYIGANAAEAYLSSVRLPPSMANPQATLHRGWAFCPITDNRRQGLRPRSRPSLPLMPHRRLSPVDRSAAAGFSGGGPPFAGLSMPAAPCWPRRFGDDGRILCRANVSQA